MTSLHRSTSRKNLNDAAKLYSDFLSSYKSANSRLAPKTIFRSLRKINPILYPGRQHDSHEFIISFLDKISEGMKKRGMLGEFNDVIGGLLSSQVICGHCNARSRTKEVSRAISLVIYFSDEIDIFSLFGLVFSFNLGLKLAALAYFWGEDDWIW